MLSRRWVSSPPFPKVKVVSVRRASTSNPYPYPPQTNPTPHQIFHLPRTASREDVKTRYYELVRIYHPDSPVNRSVSSEAAHTRFQAIIVAYDALRGKQGTTDGEEVQQAKAAYRNLSTAAWKTRQHRRAEFNIGIDDRWKDRLMMGTVLFTIAAFVFQTYTTRRQALSEGVIKPRQSTTRIRKNEEDDLALQATNSGEHKR